MALVSSTKTRCWVTACLLLIHAVAIHAEEKVALPKLPKLGDLDSPEQLITTTDTQGISHNSICWKNQPSS